jgi:hypothetical protein
MLRVLFKCCPFILDISIPPRPKDWLWTDTADQPHTYLVQGEMQLYFKRFTLYWDGYSHLRRTQRLFLIKHLKNQMNRERLRKVADSIWTSKVRYGL